MATFGRTTTAGATDPGATSPNDQVGTTFALAEQAAVSKLTVYASNDFAADAKLRAVIYPAAAGTANGTAVAVGTETTVTAGAALNWVELPITATLNPNSYWLGIWVGGPSPTIHAPFDSSSGTSDWDTHSTYSPTATPAAFSSHAGSFTGQWCIYATYTPATAGSFLPLIGPS